MDAPFRACTHKFEVARIKARLMSALPLIAAPKRTSRKVRVVP